MGQVQHHARSYVCGTGGSALMHKTVGAALDDAAHPKVQSVQVFGVPDPQYGEQVCAWIKLQAGETSHVEEIVSFCRGQIAHYKVPRYIEFVEEFPMTVTGKVQKFAMRDRMTTRLGLDDRTSG